MYKRGKNKVFFFLLNFFLFYATYAAYSSKTNEMGENEIMWLFDSGCTDHIINDVNYFDKSIDLKESVNIYLGDNRSIKATKIVKKF